MAELSPLLQRWHKLSRADRKAILARLSDGQRSDLMAMIAAAADGGTHDEAPPASSWTMFSPRMAAALSSIEDQPDTSPATLAMTPAGARLLLDSAREIRAAQVVDEGWSASLRRRWQKWVKDLDL